jgi:hypothetical protein
MLDTSRHYEFRADRFSYLALGGLPFAFSVLFTYFTLVGRHDSAHPVWAMALFAYAVCLGVFLYLMSFRITMRDGVLTYRRPFGPSRSMRLCDIKHAKVDVRLLTTRARRPPYALYVEPLAGTDARPLIINIKLLSREDLRTLFDLLGDKVLDEKHRMDGVIGKRKKRS